MRRAAVRYTPPRAWVFAASLALMSTPAMAQAPAAAERADLRLSEARWQRLPTDIQSVTVDRGGRAWFEAYGGEVDVPAMRERVAGAAGARTPFLLGGRVVLHDGRGRVWLVPGCDRGLLMGYDPATGAWIERRAATAAEHGWQGSSIPPPPNEFVGLGRQGRSGTLLFADRAGVHVLEGDRWSYQPLYKAALERKAYGPGPVDALSPPQLALDPDGRVYAWGEWSAGGVPGTPGFFLYDRGKWSNVTVPEAAADRLTYVVPLPGGQALASVQGGTSRLWPGAPAPDAAAVRAHAALLGHSRYVIREEAQKRLADMGASIGPILRDLRQAEKDLEAATRLDTLIAAMEPADKRSVDGWEIGEVAMHGWDAQGNLWFWAVSSVDPSGQQHGRALLVMDAGGRLRAAPPGVPGERATSIHADRRGRLWITPYGRQVVRVAGQEVTAVTDAGQVGIWTILAEDGLGRVFLKSPSSSHILACLPDAPDRRQELPVTAYELAGVGPYQSCMDSEGRTWALRPADRDPGSGETVAMLSRFEQGQWRPLGDPMTFARIEPQGLMLLQPLRDGGLLVAGPSRAAFFDGETWHSCLSLRRLIEERQAEIARRIDNRLLGRGLHSQLRVDPAGRLWVARLYDASIHDGPRQVDLAAAWPGLGAFRLLLPLPDGTGMLAYRAEGFHEVRLADGRVQAARWKGSHLPTPLMPSELDSPAAPWIDGTGRLWLPAAGDSCIRVDAAGPVLLSGTGPPRLLDSRGGAWFFHWPTQSLIRLDAHGRRAALRYEGVRETSALAEDRAGRFWIACDSGLLCVEAPAGPDGVAIRVAAHYEKGLPSAGPNGLWVDRDNRLWIHTSAHWNNRLFRVDLPASPPPATRPGGPPG